MMSNRGGGGGGQGVMGPAPRNMGGGGMGGGGMGGGGGGGGGMNAGEILIDQYFIYIGLLFGFFYSNDISRIDK